MKKKKKTQATRSKSKAKSVAPTFSAQSSHALRVEVTHIKFYERNPRRSRNPQYDRIKASILKSGMDQTLSITQRPGDQHYIVQAGGNTRLQILQELYAATADERFHWVDCRFVEWDRESTVLLAHLRENELRGDLDFIDRARGVIDAKCLLAEEFGSNQISDRQMEAIFSDHGYSVGNCIISLMGYAVSVLSPVLPVALGSGLGKPQVQRIRSLERVAQKVWGLRELGTDAEFDGIFEVLCRRYDTVDWQCDSLRQALENEIAEAAEVSIQVIRMEFDCRLAGREPDIPDFAHEGEVLDGDFPVSLRDEPDIPSAAEIKATQCAADGSPGGPESDSGSQDADEPLQVAIELPPEPASSAMFRRIGLPPKGRMPLKLLRETAYTLAQRLARRHGFETVIEPLDDNGLGFLVCDMPSASVLEQLDDEMLAEVASMWWQLMAFAEMMAAPSEVLSTLMEAESDFRSALLADDRDSLSDTVWNVNSGELAQRFWCRLNHEDWCDWLCLAHNYRELHRMASMMNQSLWSSAA